MLGRASKHKTARARDAAYHDGDPGHRKSKVKGMAIHRRCPTLDSAAYLRLPPHSPHAGANINFGPLTGGARCGAGRHCWPSRLLEQTEQLFWNEACP